MKKILIVDDDNVVIALLSKRLEADGFQVVAASNGRDGVRLSFEEQPDLMVWDVMLPEMDGYNALREVRADSRTARVPVIILTAKEEMEDLFRIEGVSAFFVKPLNVDVFLVKVRELTSGQTVKGDPAAASDLRMTRVLMVDDDPTFIRLMECFLQKLGCRGMVCRNGREALECMLTYNFDICFMDIMMPEMNGVEAASIIREKFTRKMPIIAITSSTMSATKDKCLDVGMNDFVCKPVSLDMIREYVNRFALKSP